MTRGRCGELPFGSAFDLPIAPTAGTWLDALGRRGLTVTRARLAAHLGHPDPFPVRALAAAAPPEAPVVVEKEGGLPLDPDAADAVLVDAARARPAAAHLLSSLFDARPPGPRVRALPLDLPTDHPLSAVLRWPDEEEPPPFALGEPEWIPAAALGEPDVATVRALLPLPDGRIAAGTDYGLAIGRDGRWAPFPYPRGARREARRVEAMAVHRGRLVVGTQKSWFEWDLSTGDMSARGLPRDEVGGHDDVRSMLATDGRLLIGWRRQLEGADGPAEALSATEDRDGTVWVGTIAGELHVVDAGGPVRTFEAGGRPRPVRHLAFARGALWVAAAGALHRFDGATWSSQEGEPVGLRRDPAGRLWAIRAGRVEVGAWPAPLDLPVERPWCLGFAQGALWVGAVGGLLRVPLG